MPCEGESLWTSNEIQNECGRTVIDTGERGVMKVLSYRTVLRREPEGGYTIMVPSLPGCVTYGETVDHALTMAKESIELYIESLQAYGEEIPGGW